MESIVKAVIYARVSTGEQTAENQLRDLRGSAATSGWRIDREFVDHGVSGAKADRAGLRDLMDYVRRAKPNILLVWRYDRFARSLSHLVTALEELRVLGVDFISYQERVDTRTPQGRMVFGVMASLAEFERELIRERVFSGLRRAKAQGVELGRPRLPADKIGAVLALRGRMSHRDIARHTGVGKGTVYRLLSAPLNPPQNVELPLDGAGVDFAATH